MSKKLLCKIIVYSVLVFMGYISYHFAAFDGAYCYSAGVILGSQAVKLLNEIHNS
jgi:TM2 domain-containing membrane protein YozV